jgi:hypothetical protein
MYKYFLLIVIPVVLFPIFLKAQSCPENIGFEYGNFTHWNISVGNCVNLNGNNTINLTSMDSAVVSRHTIVKDPNQRDPYGDFPLLPNNGSNYAIKLGNNGTGSQAESVSYLIDVPADSPEYTLTYQYAVVLEDPSHIPAEQPRFIARVKDISTGEYITCASFEYISTANLPGFKKSPINSGVIYKDWTPVTLNLSNYAGKKLLLEFITADCAINGHFGYAYIDVNNICGNIIEGGNYCAGATEINVNGPSGFKEYAWYNESRTVKLGTNQILNLKQIPADGTKILLDMVPYDGFGCPSTASTIIKANTYQLQVKNKSAECYGKNINLASAEYILNYQSTDSYEVYTDANLTQKISNIITNIEAKTYYVKARNYNGCESVEKIEISILEAPEIKVDNPNPAVYNSTVDLTDSTLYNINLANYKISFFSDAEGLLPISNPKEIKTTGTYYVKFDNNGCIQTKAIAVNIYPKPVLIINQPATICSSDAIDLTNNLIYNGSEPDLTFAFYVDDKLTQILDNPNAINKTGTYYVKATDLHGCIVYDSIKVNVYEAPILKVKNPEPVCYPATIDITEADLYTSNSKKMTFSYFTDKELTKSISNPKKIKETGTYYVKATNENGCFVSNKIEVTINKIPTIVLNNVKAIYEDEYLDLTDPKIIEGSENYISVEYYYDADLFSKITDPTKINKAGVYYIKILNNLGCYASAMLTFNMLKRPRVVVPTAFTPQKSQNNRLLPFCVSLKKLNAFKVFNKWGILVYQTNNINDAGWDGQFKNRMQPFETFTWFAEGIDLNGNLYQSHGKTIMIL